MRQVNIHQAKTHLSKLIQQAANGEPFVIARAGKPLVQVKALEGEAAKPVRRRGFLAGQIAVPEDFDIMGGDEIAKLFNGAS